VPRQARLDVPGTLRHVIIRGIEGSTGTGRFYLCHLKVSEQKEAKLSRAEVTHVDSVPLVT